MKIPLKAPSSSRASLPPAGAFPVRGTTPCAPVDGIDIIEPSVNHRTTESGHLSS